MAEEQILKESTELGEALDNINLDEKRKKLSAISAEQHGALISILCFNHLNLLPEEKFNIAREFLDTTVSVKAMGREQHVHMVAGHQETKKGLDLSGLFKRQV